MYVIQPPWAYRPMQTDGGAPKAKVTKIQSSKTPVELNANHLAFLCVRKESVISFSGDQCDSTLYPVASKVVTQQILPRTADQMTQ